MESEKSKEENLSDCSVFLMNYTEKESMMEFKSVSNGR